MNARFIVNPRSGGGRTGSALAALERQIRDVFPHGEILHTTRMGHAIELAAGCAGADLVVGVGGDGTANEVINGLARLDAAERPAFGVLPAGTGSDLVKSIGMPRDVESCLEVLRDGGRRSCDWLNVDFGGHRRTCINVAGFGMNGAIVHAVNQGRKRLGGRVTFALATAKVAVGWRAPQVRIEWESPNGPGSWTGPLASTFVANGSYCGGGMWVGAGGSMSDGLAEMTILPELPLSTTLIESRRLYTGTIREVPGVVFHAVSAVRAEVVAGSPVMVDVDGEQPGDLPISIAIEENAVLIAGNWRGVTPA